MNDEEHSLVLKALADETRLRLIRLLNREELNVQEICDILQMPQPRISRHLATLKSIHLVEDRRDGTRAYYSLCKFDEILPDFKSYLESICQAVHSDLDRLQVTLTKRAQISREFASDMAEHWDEISADLHSPLASMFSVAALTPRGITVADLGSGTGIMLPLLSKCADKVYAVDQSGQMLDMARKRCSQLSVSNVEYVCSDLHSLEKKLPQTDAQLLHFVLHQVASPATLLKDLRKSLKKNGRIVIVDQIKHDDESVRRKYGSLWLGFEKEQLLEWLTDAGFVDVDWMHLSDDAPKSVFMASATN
ncbi:MAG: metalloregulator ArsR/SmtB family transcription factor [Lentisphaeraceae bacterium]|nr:metalloregulator ArsR/SmtB family transcription factor [Lentisphaeraceae bacterium]